MSAKRPAVAAVCDRREGDGAHRAPLQDTEAPTGRKKPAQGDALGNPPPTTSSPEGAKQGGEQLPNMLDELNEVLAA